MPTNWNYKALGYMDAYFLLIKKMIDTIYILFNLSNKHLFLF